MQIILQKHVSSIDRSEALEAVVTAPTEANSLENKASRN